MGLFSVLMARLVGPAGRVFSAKMGHGGQRQAPRCKARARNLHLPGAILDRERTLRPRPEGVADLRLARESVGHYSSKQRLDYRQYSKSSCDHFNLHRMTLKDL